jgi:DNA polymerase-3 subunit alpha
MLAYQTAYLKAHHPVAFMAAMLTSEMASKDNVAKYMQECRGMGIAVLPPAVNESNWTFTVVGDTIRFGLGAVKGLGEGAVEAILAARSRVGRFRGIAHLAAEVDEGALNRKVFECLIKAGAFDGHGCTRAAALQALDGILGWAQRRRDEVASGQGSLFAAAAVVEPAPDPNVPEWSETERLRNEKETLGFYLTGSPLSQHEALLAGKVTHNTSELIDAAEQEGNVAIAGVVARVRRIKIKSGANAGRLRALFSLEDEHGSVAVSLFADTLQKYDHLLQEDAVVLVRGNVRMRTEVELTAQEVVPLSALELEQVERLDLVIGERVGEADLLRLRDALAEHAGELPVRLTLCRNGERVCVAPAGRFKVRYTPPLVAAVEAILGAHSVVPVLQEPASFVEEPDDLLPAEEPADELDVAAGEIEAEALVS